MAVTIKPSDPKSDARRAGFYGEPGGRIFFGGDVRMLIRCAFNVQDYQIVESHGSTNSQWFEINAVPDENSTSRGNRVANAEPTPEQQLMLQDLLHNRFGLQFHFETKQSDVYILTRGKNELRLTPAKDPSADPRVVVLSKGSIYDGEAVAINTTADYLARRLSRYLAIPVLNETRISGAYDFHLAPDDPENRDSVHAVLGVVDRLGFKIKRGRGPTQILVIDRINQPSEN